MEFTSDFKEVPQLETEIKSENTEKPVNQDEPIKRKKGRPKKNPEENIPKIKTTQEKLNFEELKNQYKTVKTEEVKTEEKAPEVKNAALVSGYILLVVCDSLIPSFVVKIMRSKKPDLKPEQLTLSKSEMDKMEPLADAAATELFGKMGAVPAFFFSITFIYLGKAMTK